MNLNAKFLEEYQRKVQVTTINCKNELIHQSNSINVYRIHLVDKNKTYNVIIFCKKEFCKFPKQAEIYDSYKNLCFTRSRLMLGL